MLHQNYKYFPHVTPSNTGIENVIELLYDELNDEETRQAVDIEAIYYKKLFNKTWSRYNARWIKR